MELWVWPVPVKPSFCDQESVWFGWDMVCVVGFIDLVFIDLVKKQGKYRIFVKKE